MRGEPEWIRVERMLVGDFTFNRYPLTNDKVIKFQAYDLVPW